MVLVSTLSIGHSPQPHLRPSERWMSWSSKPPCRIVRRCNISCCMWTCLADWVKSDFQCIMVHDVQGFWEFIIGNYMYQIMFITLLIITITSSPWEFLTCTTGIHREIPKSFHCPCANCAPISVTETSSSVRSTSCLGKTPIPFTCTTKTEKEIQPRQERAMAMTNRLGM
jgi:hypothetical protein